MRSALIVLGILQAVGCWILYYLFIQHGRLLLRVEALERPTDGSVTAPTESSTRLSGLPKQSVLADFALESLKGDTMTLSQWRGQRLLLLFVNGDCFFSRELIAAWSSRVRSDIDATRMPVIICQGNLTEARRLFDRYQLPFPVLLDPESMLSSVYRIRATPTGYLVDEHGATDSELLIGEGELLAALKGVGPDAPLQKKARGLSPASSTSRLVRDGLKKGTRAPQFSLPDLEGGTISLEDFYGQRILLVFSDPECQPCQALVPELERLKSDSSDLQILMISRGDLDANRKKAAEHHVSFPIALQRHWEISREYGMFATPIGYLINREGILDSGVAVGMDAILQQAANVAVTHERVEAAL